jgi:hypothetical protein
MCSTRPYASLEGGTAQRDEHPGERGGGDQSRAGGPPETEPVEP